MKYNILIICITLLVLINSCNTISKNEYLLDTNWRIKEEVNFLNNFNECYLSQNIEFLSNNYYIYRTECDSETPYGLIKVG